MSIDAEIYPVDYNAVLNGTLPVQEVLLAIHKTHDPKRKLHAFLDGLNSREEYREHKRHGVISIIAESTAQDYDNNPAVLSAKGVQAARAYLVPRVPEQIISPRSNPPPRFVSLGTILSEHLKRDGVLTDEVIESLASFKGSKEPLAIEVGQNCPWLAESFMKIQKAFGAIRELFIVEEDNAEESSKELIRAINLCIELQVLDLAAARTLTTEEMNTIAWPKSLQRLNLENTTVDEICLKKIAESCRNLTRLNVKKCNSLPFEEMLEIAFPALEDFEYTPLWCDKLARWQERLCIDSIIKNPIKNAALLTVIAETILEDECPYKIDALKLLQEALRLNPRFLRARASLSELLRTGAMDVKPDLALSLKIVEEGLAIDPQNPRCLACQARHLINNPDSIKNRKEMHAQALLIMRQVAMQAPNDDFVLATLADALHCAEENKKDAKKALEYVNRALELNPKNHYGLIVKASILPANHQDEKNCLFLAYQINPFEVFTIDQLSGIYFESQDEADHKKAIEMLEEAIKSHEKFAVAHEWLAKFYREKEPLRAIEELEKALKDNPDSVEALFELSHLYRYGVKGIVPISINQAIALYERILVIDPLDAGVLTLLAEILFFEELSGEKRNTFQARQLLKRAHGINQSNTHTLTLLGQSYLTKDGKSEYDPKKGVALLKDAIRLNPKKDYWPHLKLAEYYQEDGGDPRAAEQYYKRAEEIAPREIECHRSAAKFWMKNYKTDDPAQPKKALDHLEKALIVDPSHPGVNIAKATVLLSIGAERNKEQAVQAVQTALKKPLAYADKQELALLLTDYPSTFSKLRDEIVKVLKSAN